MTGNCKYCLQAAGQCQAAIMGTLVPSVTELQNCKGGKGREEATTPPEQGGEWKGRKGNGGDAVATTDGVRRGRWGGGR